MELWGFAAMAAGVFAVIFAATRLIGRTNRNRGDLHGGGYSKMSDAL